MRGAIGNFVIFNVSNTDRIIITGNKAYPESRNSANGTSTRAVLGEYPVTSKSTHTNISGNFFSGFKNGIENCGKTSIITDNKIISTGNSISPRTEDFCIISNNTLRKVGALPSQNAVTIPDGMEFFTVTGNIISGFNDGVNLSGSAVNKSGIIASNTMADIARNGVSNFATGYNGQYSIVNNGMSNESEVFRSRDYYVGGERLGRADSEGWLIKIKSYTKAQLTDKNSTVNTVGVKSEGVMVRESTEKKVYYASGSSSTSSWYTGSGVEIIPV